MQNATGDECAKQGWKMDVPPFLPLRLSTISAAIRRCSQKKIEFIYEICVNLWLYCSQQLDSTLSEDPVLEKKAKAALHFSAYLEAL